MFTFAPMALLPPLRVSLLMPQALKQLQEKQKEYDLQYENLTVRLDRVDEKLDRIERAVLDIVRSIRILKVQ